jgi:hypothetical protein
MIFDRPQTLRRIWLVFEDSENARTQEFVLRWSRGQESSFREIVRQPWNFSPGGSVRENEDYTVHLSEVGILELIIVPDKSGSDVRASLRSFRVAWPRTAYGAAGSLVVVIAWIYYSALILYFGAEFTQV